ncbi:MAG TPA: molybdopterin oxidoreductase family protein [Nocardioidaceae bacterium]|nr:molybdopterin oxidoreductase family protein [Nocardioidaceae bacterium]
MATTTHCPYCSLQCGMRLSRKGRETVVETWDEFPTNQGAMCRKGWTSAALLSDRERLTTPLVRDPATGAFRAASWDEALGLVADRLSDLRQEHGNDAVAVFGGGGLTNEKAYTLGKFARACLGTSMVDYNGRWCMSSAASAGIRAFGIDRGLPFPLADVERTDVLVLVGSNLAETMPPAARHLDRLRERGGKVVAVDPRRTATAERADVHVQPVPGTDLALAQGLLHAVVAGGFVDQEYVDQRTVGFEPVRRSVMSWWPEQTERVTGVPAGEVRELARLLGEAEKVVVLTARGAEQHAQGSDTVLAWINLALALGQCGKPYSGYGCLTGQGNGQGGREHGQKADQLPGYRSIEDPAAREHIAAVWGIDPDALPGKGKSAYELLDALGVDGGPKAMLVFGSNIVVSAPNANHVTERLDALDLLVVADVVMSETAARADVVLPVTQWAEETGTMTNLEGRVILRRKAVDPPKGVRSDLEVLAGLAERLGSQVSLETDPQAVFAELGRASAGGPADYAGIDHDRIAKEDGVFWPCPSPDHPGTKRMFLDRFATPDGRARFHVVTHRGPAEQPCGEYPLHLTTGRVLAQYQSGAQTRRVRELGDTGAFVELHPMLAARVGVTEGERLRVSTRRGTMQAPARLSDAIRPDTVFVPFHWVGANQLTNDALDPASRMPEFKVCAAAVSAVCQTHRKWSETAGSGPRNVSPVTTSAGRGGAS